MLLCSQCMNTLETISDNSGSQTHASSDKQITQGHALINILQCVAVKTNDSSLFPFDVVKLVYSDIVVCNRPELCITVSLKINCKLIA